MAEKKCMGWLVERVASCVVQVTSTAACSLRIRRAVLEASIRSRKDLNTALSEFHDWLEKITKVR